MISKHMDIIPNIEIGIIEFGMNPETVKNVMGSDLVYEEWMGGNLNDALFYSDLIIGFNDCDENEPLPDSYVVEFRANGSHQVKFEGIALAELTRDKLKNMVAYGVSPEVDKNQDVSFKELGISFGFDQKGAVCLVEMWRENGS